MDDFTCQIQCDEMDAQEYHMAQEWAAECERERWELWACVDEVEQREDCLLYTSPSPRDVEESRMPSSA